jgi:hypothetical protein
VRIKEVPELFTNGAKEVTLVNLQDWFRVMVFEVRDLEDKRVKLSIDYHLWIRDGSKEEKLKLFPKFDKEKWEEQRQGLKEFQTLKDDWEARFTDISID